MGEWRVGLCGWVGVYVSGWVGCRWVSGWLCSCVGGRVRKWVD